MNSFQSDYHDGGRPFIPRKQSRASRCRKQPEEGQRTPPEDEELIRMMEEIKDPEQAELLRQSLKNIDTAKEEGSEEDSSEDLDIEKQIA